MTRIQCVRLHRLRQDLPVPISWCAGKDLKTMEVTVVEVETDCGQKGWGDGGCDWEHLCTNADRIIGRSPFEAEAIFMELGGLRREGPLAGVLDMALWDLQGKLTGRPVCELLGKVWRRRIMPYASIGYLKPNWEDLARNCAEEVADWVSRHGFRAVKIKTGYGPEHDVAMVKAVREAIGHEIRLLIDSGSPAVYDAGTAVALGRELEPYHLFCWEEPVEKNDLEGFRRLKQVLRIPLAGGESIRLDRLLTDYIAPKLIDIVQPDMEHCGFTGARHISYAAFLHRVRVIPHTWSHTPLRIAATMHWLATIPQEHEQCRATPEPLLELHPPHETVGWDITRQTIGIDAKDGRIPLPPGPGLGIEVDPEKMEPYCTETREIR